MINDSLNIVVITEKTNDSNYTVTHFVNITKYWIDQLLPSTQKPNWTKLKLFHSFYNEYIDIQVGMHVSGITFIRWSHSQKTFKKYREQVS